MIDDESIYDILPEEDNETTYMIEVMCSNCKFIKPFQIPKGSRSDKYLKNELCELCGCNIIEPKQVIWRKE